MHEHTMLFYRLSVRNARMMPEWERLPNGPPSALLHVF